MRLFERISARLIVLFVVTTTLLLTAFGVFSYQNSKNALESQLSAQMKRVEERLQIGLPAPLWNFDSKLLDTLLAAEMGDPAVAAIVVINAKQGFVAGSVRDSSGVPQAANASTVLTGEKTSAALTFDDSGQIKPVGTANVYSSRAAIDAALRAEIVSIVVEVVVLNIALIGALLFGMNRIVLSP